MRGAVQGRIEIKVIVVHGVSTETSHVLPEITVDDRRSIWRRSKVVCDPGEAPSRSAVPQVLYRRIVIQVQAVNEFLPVKLLQPRVAYVGIVHAEVVILGVIGDLNETSDVLRPRTRKEQRNVLRKLECAILGGRYRLFRLSVGSFKH